ncbi:MAG: hypothetical protein LC745_11980, partial [Planctomycetia bacterium]|nr:hypothetical protein [Planctomycetia bacterium]
ALVADPDGLAEDPARKKTVDDARADIARRLAPPLVGTDVDAARKAIAGFRTLVDDVDKALKKEAEAKRVMEEALAGTKELALVADPDGLAADPARKRTVDDARADIARRLTPPLVGTDVDAARKAIAGFRTLVDDVDKALKKEAEAKRVTEEALAGTKELALVADPDGLAEDPARKKTVDDARADIARRLAPPLVGTDVDAARKAIAGFRTLVRDIDAELKTDATIPPKKKAAATQKYAGRLLVNGAALDATTLGAAYDAFGAKGLDDLIAGLGDAAAAEVLGAYKGDAPGLKTLNALVSDGLGSKPDALKQMLQIGCGGKPDGLKKLADALKDPKDLKALRGLVDGGGLGTPPEVLGQILKAGHDAEVARSVAAKMDPAEPAEQAKAQAAAVAAIKSATGSGATPRNSRPCMRRSRGPTSASSRRPWTASRAPRPRRRPPRRACAPPGSSPRSARSPTSTRSITRSSRNRRPRAPPPSTGTTTPAGSTTS